jgi:hypothetical protein
MIMAAIAVGVLACIGGHAHAEGDGPRFCIVPVKDGAVTAGWRDTSKSFRFAGLPSLVFTGYGRGPLTIDASRRLVPYVGPFPHSFFDQGRWIREPWSSRVVAITYVPPPGGGVSVLTPGSGRFEKIAGGFFDGIYVLPRRKMTVVTSNTGASLIVGDRELTPWPSHDQLAAHNIRGIYSIQDAPSLNATVVLDLDRRVYVLTDDDEWYRVGTLDKKDYGAVLDAPGSQGVLLAANHSVLFIRKASDGPHFRATVLDSGRAYGASFPFKVSSLFGQVLTYASGGLFGLLGRGRGWRHLTANGFESVPGGDIGLPPRPDPYGGRIQDLPTIGRTLIEGREGLFLYNGQTMTPIVGAERKVIGEFPSAYDLPSIQRVVVTTQNGMFNLTRDGKLVAMTTPFPADRWLRPQLADWPDAGMALLLARAGLFTLDSALVAKPIQGGDAVGGPSLGFSPFTGINPETGEMVLTGPHALFLAIDAERSHDDACRELH